MRNIHTYTNIVSPPPTPTPKICGIGGVAIMPERASSLMFGRG